jgi:hypothetical protein
MQKVERKAQMHDANWSKFVQKRWAQSANFRRRA